MELHTETVSLRTDDGTAMNAFTARPGGAGPHRGVIVLQEAFGVNGHIRDVVQRFARMEWAAIAPELYHRTAPAGFEASYTDFEAVRKHIGQLTNEGQTADLQAAHHWLIDEGAAAPDRLAAIGFCMGGRSAFLANAVLPLKAAASFYGGGIAPGLLDRAGELHGMQLLCWGGKDTKLGPEQRDAITAALRQAGKPYIETVFSEAGHGFFCDQRTAYHPASAREAWALVKAVMGEEV